jgi:hypothetical protein
MNNMKYLKLRYLLNKPIGYKNQKKKKKTCSLYPVATGERLNMNRVLPSVSGGDHNYTFCAFPLSASN